MLEPRPQPTRSFAFWIKKHRYAYSDGRIRDIGRRNPGRADNHGQYIAQIRLTLMGSTVFRNIYAELRRRHRGETVISERVFEKISMTDFLQMPIDDNLPVYAVSDSARMGRI